MSVSLPYDIYQAIVQCFGKCFYYKDKVAAFMRSAGVPRQLVEKYQDEYKFVWAKKVLSELEDSEDGRIIQKKILSELCRLRQLPDPNAPDRYGALDALRHLKDLAVRHDLVVEQTKDTASARRQVAIGTQALIAQRAAKLKELQKRFCEAVTNADRHAAGYSLEDLLRELFGQFEIDFRKSYKIPTEQIDGHFNFEGFDYIVELDGGPEQPTVQEIGGFQN